MKYIAIILVLLSLVFISIGVFRVLNPEPTPTPTVEVSTPTKLPVNTKTATSTSTATATSTSTATATSTKEVEAYITTNFSPIKIFLERDQENSVYIPPLPANELVEFTANGVSSANWRLYQPMNIPAVGTSFSFMTDYPGRDFKLHVSTVHGNVMIDTVIDP